MNIVHIDLKNIPKLMPDTALILGTFDGVHIGHQLLVNEAKKVAKNAAVLLIYTNKKITKEHQTSGVLTTLDDRVNHFANLGVSDVLLLNLGQDLLALSPDQFIDEILIKTAADYIIVGEDFRFGQMAKGTPEVLESCPHFKTLVVTPLYEASFKISTKLIKEYLLHGDPQKAAKLLGHYYTLVGLITRGFGLGNKLGYPTANVALDPSYFLPRHGVYLVRVNVKERAYFGMASLGYHPTVNEVNVPLLEVHIFDFNRDIYHEAIKVAFLEFLRPELKFLSVDDLVAQLHRDKATCDKLISEGEY